ncbi:jacalin-like lectin [Amaricoccus sp.]|uniref:jacalin-like lectin n=1 Tax=Amaricoccus sp. TaxID=1872485 RepID=UPI001B5FA0F0|nr:jacalin-like lectin [Amaricoccus sp.]MBP7002086.1 hypothetical protein [Amaricoccus sp.]
MAKPPDQSNQVLPKDMTWPEATPLDTDRYKADLPQQERFPAAREAADHTSEVGGEKGTRSRSRQDMVSELSEDELARLLAANNINMANKDASGQALMCGYSFENKALEAATDFGIRVADVTVRPGDNESTVGQSITYSEVVSNLERQTSASAKAGGGIPSIFRFDGSYTNAVATAEQSTSVTIYFQSSRRVPKAVVSIKDISLDQELVLVPAQKAVDAGDAVALLTLLKRYGHFVPTSIVLGGRLTLSYTQKLENTSSLKTTEDKLSTAADARFTVEGTPVEAGGGIGGRVWNNYEKSTVEQAKSLALQTRGGDPALGSSVPGELSGKWGDSVGPFRHWRIIGFPPHSLIPITDLFPSPLKEKALDLLRAYFRSNLQVAETEIVGSKADDKFEVDGKALRRVSRITSFDIDHGDNFDGFRWKFDLYPEAGKPSSGSVGYEGDILGRWRGEKDRNGNPRAMIELGPDEHVVSIEARCPPGEGLRRIAIRTNKARYPSVGYYGRDDKATVATVIQAPRVVGFCGYKSALVHAIGLSYLELANNIDSPDFLEKMEPILFPRRDFGVI